MYLFAQSLTVFIWMISYGVFIQVQKADNTFRDQTFAVTICLGVLGIVALALQLCFEYRKVENIVDKAKRYHKLKNQAIKRSTVFGTKKTMMT